MLNDFMNQTCFGSKVEWSFSYKENVINQQSRTPRRVSSLPSLLPKATSQIVHAPRYNEPRSLVAESSKQYEAYNLLFVIYNWFTDFTIRISTHF